MKTKITFLFLFYWMYAISLSAQFTITGRVAFGEKLEPLPNYEVTIFLPVHNQTYTVRTDQKGYYEAGFDWTSAEMLEAVVQVLDFCTGQVQEVKLPGPNGGYVADFKLCMGVNPPPPPPGCQAHFSYEQLEVNPPLVLFLDLSYNSDPDVFYHWDFGDGTASQEPAPTHEFPSVGAYQVSLTIRTDSCSSTSTQTVLVLEKLDCVCPAVYNPVCLTLDDGTVITFSNACEAACAGFEEGDWSSCEPNNCNCPEFYDPVCVISPAGDTLTYSNICFAECAGYAPDEVFKCNPINECNCDLVFDPVCVVNDAGELLRFPNACTAKCAGYPATAIVPCEGGCICPEFYDPVCVVANGDTLTFDNTCFAQCAGFGPDQVFACNPPPACESCTNVYAPVCAIGPDSIRYTFQNSCFANCHGFTDDQLFPCETGCVCPAIYDPVCVIDENGNKLTFGNRCEANCAGYTDDQIFKCDPNECNCDDVYDPVCVVVNGVTHTFGNQCEALCAGHPENQIFKCDPNPNGCGCPEIYSPVCITTDFGPAYWFVNACEAECAGFGPDQYESCGPEQCICPAIYDPVCVISMQGDTLSFGNSCEAVCAGYTEDQLFKCDFGGSCDCGPEIDPVCVYTPGGTVLRFNNPCEARCQGYDENVWVKCDETYCRAEFRTDPAPDLPLSIQFYNRSQPMGDSSILWIWDFGDGTLADEPNPLHQFPKEGIYKVTLTMTTASGCTSTYQQQVVVGSPNQADCKAMFAFDQDANDPYTFRFHDKSLGQIVAWQWYFGDGATSDEPAPEHTYQQAGIYIVSLSVTAIDGCTDLVSILVAAADDIVYNPECQALFRPLIFPDSNQVAFLNFSTAGALETHWDLGDGTTSDQLMPVHTYPSAGTFTVTLTIVTESGCKSSYSATINIAGASFTASPAYDFRSTTGTEEDWRPAVSLKLFPNPVSRELWLDLEAYNGGPLQWRMLDLNGRLAAQGQQDLGAGAQRFSIDTGDLPAGLYALQLLHRDGMITRKFIKR